MKRRNFLRAGAAALLVAGTNDQISLPSEEAIRLAEITGRSEVAEGSVEAIGVIVDHYSQNFTRYSLKNISEQLEPYVRRIADALNGPLPYKRRGELCLRGAQLCALLGRTARSLGSLGNARVHFTNSFQLASEIDHHDLMAWVTLEEATMGYQAGDPESGLLLARAALPYSLRGNYVQALSLEARCAALLSESRDSLNSIVACERAISSISAEEDSDKQDVVFNAWAPSATMHALGRAWLWLGRPKEAATAGVAAVHAASHSSSMWRQQNLSQGELVIAGALAQSGDPVGACEVAQKVIKNRQHSAYILITQSSDLLKYLRKYREVEEVRGFAELLSSFKVPLA